MRLRSVRACRMARDLLVWLWLLWRHRGMQAEGLTSLLDGRGRRQVRRLEGREQVGHEGEVAAVGGAHRAAGQGHLRHPLLACHGQGGGQRVGMLSGRRGRTLRGRRAGTPPPWARRNPASTTGLSGGLALLMS